MMTKEKPLCPSQTYVILGEEDKGLFMSKKIALTNMDIVWEDKEANKIQCEEMIKEARMNTLTSFCFRR